jgi:hypothetical protein
MRRTWIVRCTELLVCATAAAGWLGCGGSEGDAPAVSSEATGCTMVDAGSPWWNQAFPQQSGRFHVELTATPSADNLDAVIGLSRGAAAQWAALAASVRFNAEGFIDVRAGGEYRADSEYAYQAGVKYFIRFDLDVQAHRYSVWLKTWEYGDYTPIARDYAFRTEQAAAAALDHAASFLEPSRPGSLSVCSVSVVQDDTTADGCLRAAAGGGFANAQIDGTSGAMIAHFQATPSAANLDAVFGFANGPVDNYDDYAASIRFWTNGRLEARDGDTYRADHPISYVAGGTYDFWVVVDVPTKTYSMFVAQPGHPYVFDELARGYRFRTQQQAVAALDHGAAIVDSATGNVEVCAIRNASPRGLAFAREGEYEIRPLPGGGALISDGARTQRLDAAGRTIGELPAGGMLAVDAENGNVYVASGGGGALTLRSFTSELAPRWSRTYAAEGGIHAIGVYDNRQIAVAVGPDRPTQIIQIHQNGAEHLRRDLAAPPLSAIAIAPCGYTLAYRHDEAMTIEAYQPNGTLRWQRTWTGDFTVTHMASDASGVAFTGTFRGTIDFGAGPFESFSPPEGPSLNTYLVALNSDGSLRYAKRLYTWQPTGVDVHDGRVALATVYRTQMPYMELREFDAAGATIWDFIGIDRYEGLGTTGSVAIGDGGRIYANMTLNLAPGAPPFRWPFLLAFDP